MIETIPNICMQTLRIVHCIRVKFNILLNEIFSNSLTVRLCGGVIVSNTVIDSKLFS